MDINFTAWADHVEYGITICDTKGKILYMNKKSQQAFAKWGGKALIGKCLFDCHSEKSVDLIKKFMAENKSNTYTIEKNGVKKIIHQTPWYSEGKVAGMVEISIEIPFEMPHYIR